MKLVDGKIPIPSSKSLVFEGDLADIVRLSCFMNSGTRFSIPNELI